MDYKLLVAGEWIETGDWDEVLSPYDESLVGRVAQGNEETVDRAVKAAHQVFSEGGMPQYRRAEILDRAADIVREKRDELAEAICREAGKPIRTATVEAERTVDTLKFSATEARKLTGGTVPMEASASGVGKLGVMLRVPYGVVGAISPFNFPLNLVAHKLGPAVAAGCPVVLKPAGRAPLSGLALAAILIEAGLPPAMLSWVLGDAEAGAPLVAHPDIAMISFTGGTQVGFAIRAARPDIRVALELGNAAPVIVHHDADVAVAADRIAASAFTHAGQSCISVQRILVQREVHDALVDELLPRVDALVVGDPLDEATDVGPVFDPASATRIMEWIDEATGLGARVLRGGVMGDHPGLFAPTVLDGVAPTTQLMRDEAFGPVVAIAVYDGIDDAIAVANASPLGLQAAIFTARVDRAMAWARRLDYGAVLINETPTFRADHMPYGGVRDSGDAREGPGAAVMEMTRPKLIITRLAGGE